MYFDLTILQHNQVSVSRKFKLILLGKSNTSQLAQTSPIARRSP